MRLIPISELKAQKGINYSRPHLYRLVAANRFPAPVPLGGNRVAFLESEIDAWIESRLMQRDSELGVAEREAKSKHMAQVAMRASDREAA